MTYLFLHPIKHLLLFLSPDWLTFCHVIISLIQIHSVLYLFSVSLWRRANAQNVRLYYTYWQYTDLFIFRFVKILLSIIIAFDEGERILIWYECYVITHGSVHWFTCVEIEIVPGFFSFSAPFWIMLSIPCQRLKHWDSNCLKTQIKDKDSCFHFK